MNNFSASSISSHLVIPEDHSKAMAQWHGKKLKLFIKGWDKNHFSIGTFVFYNVLAMLLAMVWYRGILFRCIESQTLSASLLVLWGLVVISTGMGILLEFKRYRSRFSIFFNIVWGYGIYTIISYIYIRPSLIRRIMFSELIIFAAFYFSLLFFKWVKRKENRHPMRIRYKFLLLMLHRLFGLGFAVVIVVIGTNSFFGSSLLQPTVTPANVKCAVEYTIDNTIEALTVLDEETWKKLSIQDRLNTLQLIANIERQHLGIPHELNISLNDMNDEVEGRYNDLTHSIIISTSSLLHDSSWNLVDTICHEAYHSYQHRLIDLMNNTDENTRKLLIFQPIKQYAKEFGEYIQEENDPIGYFTQCCESDARQYADEAIWDYYCKIQNYVHTDEQENTGPLPALNDMISF